MKQLRTPEVPTILLAAALYASWLALTWWLGSLSERSEPSAGLVVAALAIVVALHGSLQHECIHGHPTGSDRLNGLIAGWPLSLWLPWGRYLRSHRAHHDAVDITDPLGDPESFYVDVDRYRAAPRVRKLVWWTTQTLLGRLLFGPAVVIAQTWSAEANRLRRSELTRRDVVDLGAHAAGVAVIVGWLIAVEVNLLLYAAGVVYPSLSITLLRSFAEHEPHDAPSLRTTIVESRLFGVVFLHNNLHVVHHDSPGLPWYRIPAEYRRRRADLIRRGHLVRRGYRSLLPFLVVPKDSPIHPGQAPLPSAPTTST